MIDMQIENPQPAGERPGFTEGEQVFLSATVTRASHLYCYFADSSGAIMRLLPNSLQRHSLVSANQAVRIPDWMSPNPGFILDAGKPGTEAVMCIATAEDAQPKLGPDIFGLPLAPLKGASTLDEVQQRYAAAMGADGLVTQTVRWSVAPRRKTAAAAAR